jgi:hypothetical protein
MNDREILEEIKEYLKLDIENFYEDHRKSSYAEELLFWIKKWEYKKNEK